MATGIGGFAEGLSQGLQSGMSMGRAAREREKYELEKPKLELEADMARRKNDASKQAQAEYSAWLKQSTMDADGNPLAPEAQPDDFTKRAAFFNLTQKALMDNQAMDPDQFMKMAQYGRELKKEGMADAMQTFMRTGDQTKALNVWNQQGAKAPEGTQLRMVKDEAGMPDVEIVAPDGKVIGTFNQAMFFMSADNVAKNYGDMQKTKFQEKEANKRTAISAGAQVQSALIGQKGAMDRQLSEDATRMAIAMLQQENKGVKDPIFEQLKDVVIELDSKFAGNAGIQMEPEQFKQRSYNTASAAYLLMMEAKKQGKTLDPFTAAALARDQLGYNTPTATPTKKK